MKDITLNIIDDNINKTLNEIIKIELETKKLKLLKNNLTELSMERHKRIRQLKILTENKNNKKITSKIIDDVLNVKISNLDKDFNVNTSNGDFTVSCSMMKYFKVKKLDIGYIVKKGLLKYLSNPSNKKFINFYKITFIKN
jgi:hypothetical protein